MKRVNWNDWMQQMVFMGPGLVFFTTIVFVPFLMGFYYSFTDWNGLDLDTTKWTGWHNLHRIFNNDSRFWYSFWFTIRFTVISVVVSNLLGFVLAVALTRALKMRNILRTVFFLPNVIAGLLLGYIWQFIYVRGFGTLFDYPWLGTPMTGFWGIVFVFVWQTSGYMMVIYIAALAGIPKDIVEASRIDGANLWHTLRRIYVPMMMPAITICLFLTTANAFKMFDLNLSLTNGGPGRATESLALNIYNEALGRNDYGLGTAKAMLFFFAVGLITITQVWLTKKKEVET